MIFNLPAPKPGLIAHFATHYSQPFQPKHFLGQFHPGVDSNADANAQALGFENGYAAIKAYYGNSDWTDTPTPMLSNPDLVAGLPKATYPTLESHIVIADTPEGRHFVANPSKNKRINSKSGMVLLLTGPPGVGKTSIAKSIGECLKRPTTVISMGGQNDPIHIKGSKRTYVD